jgi:hypothetical protein
MLNRKRKALVLLAVALLWVQTPRRMHAGCRANSYTCANGGCEAQGRVVMISGSVGALLVLVPSPVTFAMGAASLYFAFAHTMQMIADGC